jgi:hypothetical protein
MKNLRSLVGFCLLCFVAIQSPAQQSRTKNELFPEMRSRTICNTAILDKVFDAREKSNITIFISDQLTIAGEVLDKTQVNQSVQTVSIRCSNFHGAVMSISRSRMPDNSFRYNGGIINREFADVLMLKYENGQYFFKKDQLAYVMVD